MNYSDSLARASDAVKGLTDALRNDRIVKHGYGRDDAAFYTLGYLESQFASVIAELPKATQKRVLADLSYLASKYAVKEAV